jgi:hypothetical protein
LKVLFYFLFYIYIKYRSPNGEIYEREWENRVDEYMILFVIARRSKGVSRHGDCSTYEGEYEKGVFEERGKY